MVGYYWPTLFKDAHALLRTCETCRKTVGKIKKISFPLQPITVEELFQQWGLEIIGYVNPPSSQ